MFAHMALTKYALPHLQQTKGCIIYTVAPMYRQTTTGICPYASANGGLWAYARNAAFEEAKKGVRINMYMPGVTNTESFKEWTAGWTPQQLQEWIDLTNPLGKIAEPIDVARVIAFMASQDNNYMIGAEVLNDGGQMLTNSFMINPKFPPKQ